MSEEKPSLKELKEQVKQLINKKEFEAAMDLLLKGMEFYPYDLELYSRLGSIAVKAVNARLTIIIKKLEQALRFKSSQDKRNVRLVLAILNSLSMLYQKRNFQGDVTKNINPSKRRQKSDLDYAITHLKHAIELKPTDYSYMILSYTYQLQGNFVRAFDALDQGLEKITNKEGIKKLQARKSELLQQLGHIQFMSEVRELIGADRLDEVFAKLKDRMKERYEEIYKEIVLQESSWKDLSKKQIRGTLDHKDYSLERNKITSAIMDLLDQSKLFQDNR